MDRQAWHLEKQNQLQLQSEELWVVLTKGEYFRKEVAGILQMSFTVIAFLQKPCFPEYMYILINLMTALYIQTQAFFHWSYSNFRYLQNSLWTLICLKINFCPKVQVYQEFESTSALSEQRR